MTAGRAMRVIGLDPGLRATGWGVVDVAGNRLTAVAHGAVRSDDDGPLASRLAQIYAGLTELVQHWRPDVAAVEETFVNRNPTSTLKLGQVRGVVLLVPALAGVPVFEYAPNLIKKTVVGVGHAEKPQVRAMVRYLLPGAAVHGSDAADALAIAICHTQHAATALRWRAADAAAPPNPEPRASAAKGDKLRAAP